MDNKDLILSKMLRENPNKRYTIHTDFIKQPTTVGRYEIGKDGYTMSIALTYKPNWFHRTMMKLFFGIIWIDK